MLARNLARTIRLLYEVIKQGVIILNYLIRSLGISLFLQGRMDERVDELVRDPPLSRNLILPELYQTPGFPKESTRKRVRLSLVKGRSELV
jgi:hypothetical protein